jgi:hypothetical protein
MVTWMSNNRKVDLSCFQPYENMNSTYQGLTDNTQPTTAADNQTASLGTGLLVDTYYGHT